MACEFENPKSRAMCESMVSVLNQKYNCEKKFDLLKESVDHMFSSQEQNYHIDFIKVVKNCYR